MPTVNKQSTRVDFSQLTDSLANNTAVSDVFGAGGKIYFLFVSSSGTAASGFDFLKLYDTKDQVDLAVDAPDFVFPITYGVNEVFHFPDGLTITNGLGYVASNAGGTGAGANPNRTLSIQMVFK
jgi:hypothetical protein